MSNKIILNVKSVDQWFVDDRGNKNHVLYDVNLQIVQGQFVALVGGSGCGKSTLLKAILGTDLPKVGYVEVEGYRVVGPNRQVGMVYQQYSLYDFLTVEEQVMLGPMLDQTNLPTRLLMPWKWWPLRRKHRTEANELLTKFKLSHALKQYPDELSGGMRQRASIAQSLIMRPKVLLLDEPLGALDEITREKIQRMLLQLYSENLEAKRQCLDPPWTVVLVTHELDEAFYISDRVVGLSRNWRCEKNGVTILGQDRGATKVWDKCAPVYTPDEPKDFEKFYAAKKELKEVVLNEAAAPVDREEHVSFFDDLAHGVGTGVAMIRREL